MVDLEHKLNELAEKHKLVVSQKVYIDITKNGDLLCTIYPAERYLGVNSSYMEKAKSNLVLKDLIQLFKRLGYTNNVD